MNKNKLLIWFILLLTLVLPTPVHASSPKDDRVVMGGSFVLKSGDELDGNLIVIGGNATIEEDATVHGDIILLGGQVSVDGTVDGNLNVFGGSASLRENAVIEGDAVITSSALNQADGATIQGKITQGQDLPRGFIIPEKARPGNVDDDGISIDILDLFGTALSIFFTSIIVAILAMLAALFFPYTLKRTANALTAYPLLAGGAGLLTVIAAPIIIVLLTITLILIPVSVVAILASILAAFLGWIAIGYELGNRIAQMFKTKWHSAVSAGLGTMILTLVMETIGRVPCIGWTVVFVVSTLGLGAVILTRGGTRVFENNNPPPDSGDQSEIVGSQP